MHICGGGAAESVLCSHAFGLWVSVVGVVDVGRGNFVCGIGLEGSVCWSCACRESLSGEFGCGVSFGGNDAGFVLEELLVQYIRNAIFWMS
jgi:hypothetical protein